MPKKFKVPKGSRNKVFTPLNPSCVLCRFCGISTDCMFLETGKCPYLEGRKDIRRQNK